MSGWTESTQTASVNVVWMSESFFFRNFNKSVILNKHLILYIIYNYDTKLLDSSYMLSFVNMKEEETVYNVTKNIFSFPSWWCEMTQWEFLPSHEEGRCEKNIRYMLWYWVSNLLNNIQYNFSSFFSKQI